MLINKPMQQNDIITIKLTSGEEIIATLESDQNDLIVSKPMTIAHNQQGMGLIPWVMTAPSSEKVNMNKSTVVAYMLTDKEIAQAYIKSTTNIHLM